MEVELDLDFWAGRIDDLKREIHAIKTAQPIRRPFQTAITTPAAPTNPFVIAVTSMTPAKGRLWEITEAGVFYVDGHTNQAGGSGSASATVTPTTAGQTIVSLVLQRGVYNITAGIQIGGTTTAADGSNVQVSAGLTTFPPIFYGSTAGSTGSGSYQITANGAVTVILKTVGVPSGTATYAGSIVATLVSSVVIADIYGGPSAGLDAPGDMASFIGSGTVPVNFNIGRDKAYAFQSDYIYAWVYNVPGNQQLILAGTLLDWRIEDRTEMLI